MRYAQYETVGWHHRVNGHKSEQALGNGEGQGSPASCSPWGHKQSDTTKRLNNHQATDSVPTLPEESVLPHWFTPTRLHPQPTPSRIQFQVHVVICASDQLATQPLRVWFKLLEWLRETFDLADHQFIIKGYNPGNRQTGEMHRTGKEWGFHSLHISGSHQPRSSPSCYSNF